MGDVHSFRAERALVVFLRAHRDVGERLQARHRADERGHCAGCRLQRRFTRAPCRLLLLAEEALDASIPGPRTPEPDPEPARRAL